LFGGGGEQRRTGTQVCFMFYHSLMMVLKTEIIKLNTSFLVSELRHHQKEIA